MTTYIVRTDQRQAINAPDAVRLLDWAPTAAKATIQIGEAGADFFSGWRPTRQGADMLLFGAAVYCADKATQRRDSQDSWTRDISIELPTRDTDRWHPSKFESALNFLTGDRWHIQPYSSPRDPLLDIAGVPEGDEAVGVGVDGVCLFSGGLDSLCGVIDLLEQDRGRRLCLLSHHEGGQASTAQQLLYSQLCEHYGEDRILSRRLYLRPAPKNKNQARPLPARRENTTRSRSMLFLSAAWALASAEGPNTPVYVPENGFIGINVPLTRSRVGSASTRTTHPHFFRQISDATAAIGLPNPIVNPYRYRSKGQMLKETQNPQLLRRLAPLSVSCSHPETARYVGRKQGNCGYCFPCLIRRSSMAQVGWDTEEYAWDIFDPDDAEVLLDPARRRGADLRAVLIGTFIERPDRDILRNGPIPQGDRDSFIGVWRQGLQELRTWLVSGAEGKLAVLIESLS